MLTKTRTIPGSSIETQVERRIEKQVDERGFSLYEWISPDELRMSVQADYLSIVKMASTPLAIVTLIAGFIGLMGGAIGVIIAVFGVLSIFYAFVFLFLIIGMLRKSYLYTRGADVVITDNHYVTGGKVISKNDFSGQKQALRSMEETFREPLFEPSKLKEYVDLEKDNLFEQLKGMMVGGGELMSNLGRSRDAGNIVLVLLVVGILYGAMMGLVYFIGVFFVAILARVFSWIANRWLLATNNTEHTIQNLFSQISDSSEQLKQEKENGITLLSQASKNAWKENLSARISESFEKINNQAKFSTEKSVELSHLLENSRYKEIFNFPKYGKWLKIQVLEPIEEILVLLDKNLETLLTTKNELIKEIESITNNAHKGPLELQKNRIEIQIENFEKIKNVFLSYQKQLQSGG